MIIDIFDDFFQDYIVLIPINGIEMEIDKLSIGNIVLKKMTNDLADDIINKIENYAILSPFLEKSNVKFATDLINNFRKKNFDLKGEYYCRVSYIC